MLSIRQSSSGSTNTRSRSSVLSSDQSSASLFDSSSDSSEYGVDDSFDSEYDTSSYDQSSSDYNEFSEDDWSESDDDSRAELLGDLVSISSYNSDFSNDSNISESDDDSASSTKQCLLNLNDLSPQAQQNIQALFPGYFSSLSEKCQFCPVESVHIPEGATKNIKLSYIKDLIQEHSKALQVGKYENYISHLKRDWKLLRQEMGRSLKADLRKAIYVVSRQSLEQQLAFVHALLSGGRRSDDDGVDYQCGDDLTVGAEIAIADVLAGRDTAKTQTAQDLVALFLLDLREGIVDEYFAAHYDDENRSDYMSYNNYLAPIIGIPNRFRPHTRELFPNAIKHFKRHYTTDRVLEHLANKINECLWKSYNYAYKAADKKFCNSVNDTIRNYIMSEVLGKDPSDTDYKAVLTQDPSELDVDYSNIQIKPELLTRMLEKMGFFSEPYPTREIPYNKIKRTLSHLIKNNRWAIANTLFQSAPSLTLNLKEKHKWINAVSASGSDAELINLLTLFSQSKDFSKVCEHSSVFCRAIAEGRDTVALFLKDKGIKLSVNDQAAMADCLINYIYSNNHRALERLVHLGVDVNAQGTRGDLPLSVAAKLGYRGLVRTLLTLGARSTQPDSIGRIALHYAAESGNVATVRELIKKNIQDGTHNKAKTKSLLKANLKDHHKQTPFSLALQAQHWPVAQLLHDQGARLSNENWAFVFPMMAQAVNTKDLADIATLTTLGFEGSFNNQAGWCLFDYATQMNHTELSLFLLERRLSLPSDIATKALSQASQRGELSIVHSLIPNMTVLDRPDRKGITPLGHAVKGKHWKIAEHLKARGATMSEADQKILSKKFHKFVADGNHSRITQMIKLGINVDVQDSLGNTALIRAIESGRQKTIQLLLQQRANYNQANNAGQTPLMVSITAGKYDIVKFLLARPNINVTALNHLGRSALGFLLEQHQWGLAMRAKDSGAVLTRKDKSVLFKLAVTSAKQGDKTLLRQLPDYGGPKASSLRKFSINIQHKLFTRPALQRSLNQANES